MVKLAQVSIWILCLSFIFWITGSTIKEIYAMATGAAFGAIMANLYWVK